MATPLAAQRGGFARSRDHPRIRPMHGPVLAQPDEPELGNPLSVPEDASIGYGRPADGAGEPAPLRIASITVCPVVALQAELEDGTVIDLAGDLADFVPFARQVLAMQAAMAQAPQAAPVYEEYDEQQSQAG
jgi:hypothetical protein